MANLDWEAHKAEIERLYIHEGKSLKEMIQIMRVVHGFWKSKSQYETQFAKWRFKKYHMGSKNWRLLDQNLKKRGADQEVYVNGVLLEPKRVKRELGRQAFQTTIQKEVEKLTSRASPKMPEGVLVYSPAPSALELQWPSNLPWFKFSQYAFPHNAKGSFHFQSEIDLPASLVMIQPSHHVEEDWFLTLDSIFAWVAPHSQRELQVGSRMAAAMSIVMPEEYNGQHIVTSRELSSRSDSKLREFIRISLYLLSNKMVIEDTGPSGKEELMLKIFRMSGLDNIVSLRGLISRENDMSAGAIAESLFGTAIKCLDTQVIKLMLEAGMDPDTLIIDVGFPLTRTATPLGFIATKREISAQVISSLLLQHKASIDLYHNGESALDIAVKHSNQIMVKTLASNGAHITPKSLHSAVKQGWDMQIIDYLLDYGPESLIDHVFPEGTILVTAANRVQTVKALLSRNANINAIQPIHSHDQFNGLGTTLIGLAAASGNVELVQTLLLARAEVNPEPRSGLCVPPLVLAVHRGRTDIVTLLLRAGSDVSLADGFIAPQESVGKSLIERALTRDDEAMDRIKLCRNLLAKGGIASQREMEDFNTLQLFDAVIRRDAEAVFLFLSFGARVTTYDAKYGHNALVLAIRNGDSNIISLLQAAGATVAGCAIGYIANVEIALFLLHMGLLPEVLSTDGYTILVSAILAEDDDLIMFLLDWGVDKSLPAVFPEFEIPKYLRRTVLEAALCRGNLRLVERLVQRGSCIGEAEIITIVWRASVLHDIVVLRSFLDTFPTFSLPSPTAFAIALLFDNYRTIDLLLNAGIKLNGTPEVRSHYRDPIKMELWDYKGWYYPRYHLLLSDPKSVLELAIICQGDDIIWEELSVVQSLVACGDWTKYEIGRAFATSLQHGDREIARDLLASGGDVHQFGLRFGREDSKHGRYPVEIALTEGDTRLLQDLIAAGLDPNRSSGGHLTAVQRAVKCGNMKHIQMLLAAGGDVNSPAICHNGMTALQIAVQLKDIKITQMLVRAHADVNAPLNALNNKDECPLHLAIKTGNNKLVRLLLQAGANVNRPPSPFRGATALQLAVKQGDLNLVDLLLREGADVNQAPAHNGGATALQFAVIQGYIGIARMLLDAGADVNALGASINGRTALEGAAEWGRIDCLQLLLNEGVAVEAECSRQFLRASHGRKKIPPLLLGAFKRRNLDHHHDAQISKLRTVNESFTN
ncbi:hypothetical protein PENVUL_c032G00765 [Penicillium vulpinum]|uniref:Clr5 domain-containing protein n=1 Tax=Penicillium vulpinum TaxID=29845 RepID=A0A1V6RSU1_9EURO|nr:hypothetical protein PENVUL_c032G00765 [Penicillium vulpinum]